MVRANEAVQVTNQAYDELMFKPQFIEFFEQSDFANYGYWDEQTQGQRQACHNLVRKLLDRMPDKSGKILDVACGKGETTRCLLEHYPADAITAINISERQLAAGRQNVPGAAFLEMDATQLDFPNDAFGNILCVEAAFHFDTRREFLAEALRVLRPGGVLSLSDILMTIEAERNREFRTEENFLAGPEEYAAMLRELGYRNVRIDDVTEACWRRFFRYAVNYMHDKLLAREVSVETMQKLLDTHYGKVYDLEYYLLVSAEK